MDEMTQGVIDYNYQRGFEKCLEFLNELGLCYTQPDPEEDIMIEYSFYYIMGETHIHNGLMDLLPRGWRICISPKAKDSKYDTLNLQKRKESNSQT